jgi:cytochrome P450
VVKVNASQLPPGPSWPSVVQGAAFWTRPLAFLERCRARYGKRFTIRLPTSPPFVMLTDPDDVKAVFTAPAEELQPGRGARVLEPVVGTNSVLLLDEQQHMVQRKLMLPAFHGERMAALEGIMGEVTERELASWPRGTPIRLHERFQALTLEVILRAVFGLDSGPRLDSVRDGLVRMLAFGDTPLSLVPPPPDSLARRVMERVGPVAKFARLQAETDVLLFELIDERRASGEERDDVLSMLLAARHDDGSPMSPQEIRDELMTLLVAGHETTASSLAWAFSILPRQPAVLARLTEEIDNGGEDYLSATINETMRHRPVLPNVGPRYVTNGIEIGGWSYPAGVSLVCNAYLIHHDPDLYPDPYAFRPERFLGVSPGTYTWIPFGGGRRRCLGASFALLEMKLVMAALLRDCEVRADGAAEVASRRNITVRPAKGTLTVLSDRKPAGRTPAGAAAAA